MTTQRWPLLLVLLGLVLSVYWLKQKEQNQAHSPTSSAAKSVLHTQNYARTAGDSSANTVPVHKPTPLHIKNIQQMTQILKSSVLTPSLHATLDQLQKLHMQPSLFQDSNAETGTPSEVRTEKPLRGTRYFHAQYFSSDKQKPFLQHMSFEIPPGKDSLRIAAQMIKETFGPLPPASAQTPNLIAWTWKGKYTVWALKMDKDTLVSDAFNAYTAQDDGTVRIVVELDIHTEGHEH